MYAKFKDDRPEFRYAFRCGFRYYRWLMEWYPEDAHQVISLSCCEVTGVGRPLADSVLNNLRLLAQELGFRRMLSAEGKRFWIKDEQQPKKWLRWMRPAVFCRAKTKPRIHKCTRHPSSLLHGEKNRCLACLQEQAAVMRTARAKKRQESPA